MRIHMNRLRELVGIFALCATATLFTGCGGDDDNDSGAPAQLAPNSLNGQTYTLTDAAGSSSLAFAAEGNGYTFTGAEGAEEVGTYSGERQGDVWTVTTTDSTLSTTSELV